MGVDVVTQTEIERPRAEVAAIAADPSNATAWYRNIVSAAWGTSPPLAVGSRVRFRAKFMGRTLEYTHGVIDLVPGERLVRGCTTGRSRWRPPTRGPTRPAAAPR